jgi:WhiB family redox-sensing transcriptional regulator
MTRPSATTRARRTPPQPAWFEDAKCRGKSRLFYPPPNETASDRALRERYATVVCASCAAMHECREWARQQHEFGFWGGESEAARAAAGFAPRNVGELRVTTASRQPGDRIIRTVVS